MTKKQLSAKPKKRMGAPLKPIDDKTNPEGLTAYQVRRLKEEAAIRGVTFASMKRMAVDWFLTALDTKRDNGVGVAIFDDIRKDGESE